MSLTGIPLCIDGYCGLGGWAEGFLAEGWRVIGFDVERHDYGTGGYPGQLVLQNVLTLHGSQCKDADCLVFSPPCVEFSYMAMPWKRAKQIAAALRGHGEFPEGYTGSRTVAQLTALFDACFRIQREASAAATMAYGCESCGVYHPATKLSGCVFTPHYIPMVVENVKGAQPWVGRAKANYGSFYLWGDVESIGGRVVASRRIQFGVPSTRAYRGIAKVSGLANGTFPGGGLAQGYINRESGRKVPMNFHEYEQTGKPGRLFQSAAVESQKQPVWFNDDKRRATKCGGDWFGSGDDCSLMRSMGSKSSARKAASAQIAKIPFELASYIAHAFKPEPKEQVA